MEYLKLFENHQDYENFVDNEIMPKPNISHCVQENDVHYNPIPHDYSEDYLTFDIIEGGTINWKASSRVIAVTAISYSINDSEWTEITSSTEGTSFNVSAGDKVRFKGNNTKYCDSNGEKNSFDGSTAVFNIQGNVMSMIYGDNFLGNNTLPDTRCVGNLFNGTNVISAENLILPATTLTNDCYRAMFSGCTNLTTAPVLSATTLVTRCYMRMFFGCTSLNSITCLATDISAQSCTSTWVADVSASGTFVKDKNTTWITGNTGIPDGWTVVDAS